VNDMIPWGLGGKGVSTRRPGGGRRRSWRSHRSAGAAERPSWSAKFKGYGSTIVNDFQGLLVGDSNGRGLIDTVGFKLTEGKGLREGRDSKELWRFVENKYARWKTGIWDTRARATHLSTSDGLFGEAIQSVRSVH
jgi:hypothetical protein